MAPHIDEQIRQWKASGRFVAVTPLQHRMFVKELGDVTAAAPKTLLVVHGFPESSFSFHKVLRGLARLFDRIVLCDMLGYGLSDKPTQGYTYSLFEQADTVLAAWQLLGVRGGHVLAHDMGDSVTTELLARHEAGLLPGWFADGIQSITFTNGSMVLDLAALRLTQRLLLTRAGPWLRHLVHYRVFRQQVISAHGNARLSENDLQLLYRFNALQDGHRKAYLTIRYLHDRRRFETTRWLPALAQTRLPIHLCWGEDDRVARVAMAHHLKAHVCRDAHLTTVPGMGHFGQLGNPDAWLQAVSAYYGVLGPQPQAPRLGGGLGCL